jgi:uncharacterized protein YkwD
MNLKRNPSRCLSLLASLLLLGLAACQGATPAPTASPLSPTATAGLPAAALAPSATPTQPAPAPSPSPTVIPTQPPAQAAVSPSPEPTQAAPTSPPSQPTSPPAASTQPAAQDCTNLAAYYGDVNIPDDTVFDQETGFTKTWRFRNEGTCTWDPSYSMAFVGGEMLNAPSLVPLGQAVAPGEIINLSIDLKTPSRGGTFRSIWEFQDPTGKRFGTGLAGGERFWVQVVVKWVTAVGDSNPPTGGGSSAAASGGTTTPSGCVVSYDPSFESRILELINQARSANGLGQVERQSQLDAAAQAHSTDMACNDFINHIGSDGSNWFARIQAEGYSYTTALENIYVGDPSFGGTGQGAFDWWMNSQVHRDNILNAKVTQVGIAYVYSSAATYGGYFTLVLANP